MGQGIEVEYKDRVFDMYFRGTERSKGNGLGLYIVKKAVDKMKGSVTMQSTPGRGTVVSVTFPFELKSRI